MSLRQDTIDMLVSRAHNYNFDSLIQTLVDWDPVQIRKRILNLHFFVTNAAIHSDYLNQEDIDAIELLQQLYESMQDVEDPKDARLVIRVK